MKCFNFYHKKLGYKFSIVARKRYEAIVELQYILGAEKYWIHEYYIFEDAIAS